MYISILTRIYDNWREINLNLNGREDQQLPQLAGDQLQLAGRSAVETPCEVADAAKASMICYVCVFERICARKKCLRFLYNQGLFE
jgi:hypothetical protein